MGSCPSRLADMRWRSHCAGALALALVVSAPEAAAQRLPFTTYTAAQGLAGEFVSTAVEDADGFLWVGTDRGLSRFDGIGFRTFDRRDGLAHDDITSIVITRDGTMWVGTWGAAYRFDGHTFTEISVEGRRHPWERVILAVDTQDRVWCAADAVYRLDNAATSGPVLRPFAQVPREALETADALFADREGNVWAGGNALYRVSPSGQVSRVEATPGKGTRVGIIWLAETPAGRIAAATVEGIEYVGACSRSSSSLCLFPWIPEVATTRPYRIIGKPDGGLWIGRTDGLIETDVAGRFLRRISKQHGLVPSPCWPLLVDRSGDLWVGSDSGIQRLGAAGFAVFGQSEGLDATQVASIFATRAGELVVDATPQVLQRFDNGRFIPTRPQVPRGFDPSWGWYQLDLQDHAGEWWIPTARGLVRFAAADRPERLARARPVAIYASVGCFRGREIFRLYEDTRGDIWISTVERGRDALYRWNRSSGTFDCFDTRSIIGERLSATAFLDDARGTMWIGFGHGQLVRYRDARFECVMDCGGTGTHGLVHALLMDARRRLWIATAKAGLFRVDRPDEQPITAVRFTTNEGLSSNVVRALAADRFGRIYIGTDRGVDILDGEAFPIRHFGPDDGLPHPHVTSAWTDPRGDVWFGTLNGVARFTPPARFANHRDVRIVLDGVRVSGVALPLSAMGQDRIGDLTLAPDQRDIQIDVIGLPRSAAATLQFQYRRSPAGKWSVPSSTRTLVLAGLSSGSYQYEIRAIAPTGISSSNAVIVGFRVLAPIYRRPWFVVLSAAAALVLALTFYRSRLARAVALERQRAQIAMDLHDEMGSRLGSIGLLADMAAERCPGDTDEARLLDQIGEVASEMGSSLTDIVWALREEELTIESLGRHLAERGRRLFPDPARALEADFPSEWPQVRMSPGARRNAFLVGLEALHNAARHSGATRVTLRLQPAGRDWRLTVADDGTGIENGAANGSHGGGFGLDGMRRRASAIDGALEIDSNVRTGTTVTLAFNPRAEGRRGALI